MIPMCEIATRYYQFKFFAQPSTLFPGADFWLLSFETSCRNPKHPRRRDGINSPPLPPGDLVVETMDVAVVGPAQRDGKLVADLAPHGAGLGELQVVGISGAPCADQARLRSDEFEVGFVAQPARLADGEHALVYLAGSDVDGYQIRRFVIDGRLCRDRRRRGLLDWGRNLSGTSPWSLDGAC